MTSRVLFELLLQLAPVELNKSCSLRMNGFNSPYQISVVIVQKSGRSQKVSIYHEITDHYPRPTRRWQNQATTQR